MPAERTRFTKLAMRYRALWLTDPFAVMGVAFLLALIPFLYAAFTPIGSVTFTRVINDVVLEKSVGYLWAINWWPTLTIGMPLILFLALRSVQGTRAAAEAMAQAGMFATRDLSTQVKEITPAIERLWRRAFIAGAIVFLIGAGVTIADWFCVVHVPLSLRTAVANVIADPASVGGCASTIAYENDWSISSAFPTQAESAAAYSTARLPSPGLNYAFSLYVYLLLAVDAGIMFAYFAFVVSLSMTVFRISEGRSDFVIVPNLKSRDPQNRCGFELLEPVLRPCVYIAIIAFVVALLMRVQNIFLREPQAADVLNFLFGDFGNALSKLVTIDVSSFGAALSGLADAGKDLGHIFDTVNFADPNSFIGLIAVLAVLFLIALSLSYILRSAANTAKQRVLRALDTEDGKQRLEAYYGMPLGEIEKRATAMQSWPLSWPELWQARNLLIIGIVCFVYFKLIIVWAAYIVARIIRGEARPKKAAAQP